METENFETMLERLRNDALEHVRTCTEPVCERCDRSECNDCKAPIKFRRLASWEPNRCETCDRKRAQELSDERRKQSWEAWVPKEHQNARLSSDWLAKLVPVGVHDALPDELDRVTIMGPAGTGKTSLAVALLRRELERGATIMFGRAYDIANARAQQKLGTGEARFIVEAKKLKGTLVIDDLGAELPHLSATLGEIIMERHGHHRPTIVTTGLGPDQIGKRYGGGVQRRLFEGAHIVKLRRDSK